MPERRGGTKGDLLRGRRTAQESGRADSSEGEKGERAAETDRQEEEQGPGDEETGETAGEGRKEREGGRGAPVSSLLAAGKPAERVLRAHRGRGRGEGPSGHRGRRAGRAGGDAPGWGRPV